MCHALRKSLEGADTPGTHSFTDPLTTHVKRPRFCVWASAGPSDPANAIKSAPPRGFSGAVEPDVSSPNRGSFQIKPVTH